MSATEILRRLLDERGVEYFKHEDGEPLRKLEKADEPATSWQMGGASVCAVPIEGSDLFDLWIDHCAPEQAIAATLGATDARSTQAESSGTCRDEGTFNSWGLFTCSNCSIVFPLDAVKDAPSIGRTLPPKYCPNCGRKVVNE